MQLKDIMTRDFESIAAGESVHKAAQMMRDLDVGILPVRNEDAVVGTVTDRDITVRGVASGIDVDNTPVSGVMTEGVLFGFEGDDVTNAAHKMESAQVRRLFILDDADRCVGVVSTGDLAGTVDPALTGEVVEEITKPG